MVYMYHSFLIHSSADGHLGCFHVLAMTDSAAMNIGVHVSLSDLVSLVCMPSSGIAGSFIFSSVLVLAWLTSISIVRLLFTQEFENNLAGAFLTRCMYIFLIKF